MFSIDNKTAGYIKERSGAVIIQLNLEPAIGGCLCKGKQVTGSYVPTIQVGYPPDEEWSNYHVQELNSIQVFYPPNLKVKHGFPHIRIQLRKLLLWEWLEIEGAQGIAIISS